MYSQAHVKDRFSGGLCKVSKGALQLSTNEAIH